MIILTYRLRDSLLALTKKKEKKAIKTKPFLAQPLPPSSSRMIYWFSWSQRLLQRDSRFSQPHLLSRNASSPPCRWTWQRNSSLKLIRKSDIIYAWEIKLMIITTASYVLHLFNKYNKVNWTRNRMTHSFPYQEETINNKIHHISSSTSDERK